MRAVLTKDEIIDLLDNMPKEEEWISNKNIRFETFKNIISEGKSSELLRLIRTLKLHEKQQLKRGKRLHMADERFLKEAEKWCSASLLMCLTSLPMIYLTEQ